MCTSSSSVQPPKQRLRRDMDWTWRAELLPVCPSHPVMASARFASYKRLGCSQDLLVNRHGNRWQQGKRPLWHGLPWLAVNQGLPLKFTWQQAFSVAMLDCQDADVLVPLHRTFSLLCNSLPSLMSVAQESTYWQARHVMVALHVPPWLRRPQVMVPLP